MATWLKVDGGISPGVFVEDIAIVDADVALAISAGDVFRSGDAGATWAIVAGAIGGGLILLDIAAGNGIAVIRATDEVNGFLYASVDGGLTWGDVTPVGCAPFNSDIIFLPGISRFLVVDSVSAIIWTSADAATWIGNAITDMPHESEAVYITPGIKNFAAENGNIAILCGLAINPDVTYCILSSPDGDTWTVEYSQDLSGSPLETAVGWNGNVFCGTAILDGFAKSFTSPDGNTWTEQTSNLGPPPASAAMAVLGIDFYTGNFDSPDVGVSSDDGVTWTTDSPPDVTFIDLIALMGEILLFAEAVESTTGAGWTTELGPFATGFVNQIASNFGYTLGVGEDDDGNGGIWKRITAPVQVEVPPVINFTVAAATIEINNASLFVVQPITLEQSLTVPAGLIIRQSPNGGTLVDSGTGVVLVVSSGFDEVPDIIRDTAAQANHDILSAGLSVGAPTTAFSDSIPYGSVVRQDPLPGTHVLAGTPVFYAISVPRSNFDVDRTVISQYQNSPTILELVHDMAQYLNQGVNLATFYQFVWNVDTAVGFGLDIWGRIVGVSRLLRIPGNDPIVGFDNADDPKDWQPMSQGRFSRGDTVGQAYLLPDDGYRTLILTKALANIVATTAASINQLLRNLFPGRGRSYVRDLGGMAMQFVFNFSLTPTEYAILTQSGVLPHPAGVFYSVTVVPTGKFFGFRNSGNTVRPFNHGVFNSRP